MSLASLNPQRCPIQGGLYYDINPAKEVYSDSGVTPAIDGDTVQQVNSQVGSEYFTHASAKSLFRASGRNGQPYLELDQSTHTRLLPQNNSILPEATIFAVIEIEDALPTGGMGIIGYNGKSFNLGTGGSRYTFLIDSLNGGTSALGSTRPVAVDGATVILSGRYGGAAARITQWENYVKLGERDGLATYPTIDNKLIIGSWNYGGNTSYGHTRFGGKIYRVLVFNRALTDTEHEQVTDYLASLYGITSVNSDFKGLQGATQRGFVRNGYYTSADCPTKTLITLSGQSNAVGWSTADYTTIAEDYYKGDIANVKLASSSDLPQLNVPSNNGSSNDNHGVEPSLTYDVANSLDQEIYLLKYAEGGTSLSSEWNVENEGYRYTTFMSKLEDAVFNVGEINGAKINVYHVWIQGESDSNSTAEVIAYQQREADFYNALDSVYPFQKFISVKLYSTSNSYPYVDTTITSDGVDYSVNLAKDRNAIALDRYETIEAVTSSGDGVHWTTDGYISQGKAAAAVILGD